MLLDLIVSLISVAAVAQHVWALRGHFVSERMEAGAKAISAMVVATSVIYLVLTWWLDSPAWAQIAGLVIELASLALFWAAVRESRRARLRYAFDAEGPETLLVTGPYRLVRHPFYTSYILFWAGWALATASVWALIPLAAVTGLYLQAARHEERLFAGTPMAEAYAAYRARTGLFWPKLGGTES